MTDLRYVLHPSILMNKSVCCWLNSLLQAFGSLPEFNELIIKNVRKNSANQVYLKLYEFIMFNLSGKNTVNCSNELLECMNKTNRESNNTIKLNQKQNCALEFFENILEIIGDPEITSLFGMVYYRKTTCPSCLKDSIKVDKGIYKMIYKGHEEMTSLDPRDFPGASENLLDVIGNVCTVPKWQCQGCGTISADVKSKYLLGQLSRAIVLVFNKYEHNGAVTLDETMLIKNKKTGQTNKFRLRATIVHYGSPKSGHYICNAIRKIGNDEKWFKFNDQVFSELEEAPLASSDIYMAFYSLE